MAEPAAEAPPEDLATIMNRWADGWDLALKATIETATRADQHARAAHFEIRKLMGRSSSIEERISRIEAQLAARVRPVSFLME